MVGDAANETFQSLENTDPVMIWITGVDKLCTYVNQSWLDFTGRPLEAHLGYGWAEGIQSGHGAPIFVPGRRWLVLAGYRLVG